MTIFFILVLKLCFFTDNVYADTIQANPATNENGSFLDNTKNVLITVGVTLTILGTLIIWYYYDTANEGIELDSLSEISTPLKEYAFALYDHCLPLVSNPAEVLTQPALLTYCITKLITFASASFDYRHLLSTTSEIQLLDQNSALNQIVKCYAHIYTQVETGTPQKLAEMLARSHIIFTNYMPGTTLESLVKHSLVSDLFLSSKLHFHDYVTGKKY